MKEKMHRILERMHRYNANNMAELAFGFDLNETYDALVVAPSFTPYKLELDKYCKVTTLKEGAYIAGYLVEKDDLKIAWIKVGSSAGNCIDHVAVCAELNFKKMIFIGAVGALKPEFGLGDVCTPSFSISGSLADTFLKDSIRDYVPFEKITPESRFIDKVVRAGADKGYDIKKASVFCTPSIALEYYHLDEILAFGADLIEMETASFYQMAELMEIDSVALLVVSDNSATGAALVGRSEEEQARYNVGRLKVLPDMIFTVAKMD
ncbi:MAG: hypothetical protein J5626_07380 [Lachnospiraceae bacterium]|nr:hypothetical protein [Lachnospiraceae bacterium]